MINEAKLDEYRGFHGWFETVAWRNILGRIDPEDDDDDDDE